MAVYSESELYSDHDFASLHEVQGSRMHGGFTADGRYQSPRAKGRGDAIAAWTAELKQRGGDLFEADSSLLAGPRMPSVKQQCLLLRAGLGTPFWNSLTITGKIEGRGRVLAEMEFPDLQDIIVEDISGMAIGHLNKGLLAIHGLDEGGEPDKGIGGHDVMWFVARDLVFGKEAYPDVEPPESISRPEAGKRWMEEIEPAYEGLLSFLMNLLMIEFRAEIGFAATQDILRNPQLFTDRREQAEEAAEIVERIRTDEEIHVESLRLYLGEIRELTIRTTSGDTIAGSELIDRFWSGMVHWATQEQPAIAAANSYDTLRPVILAHDNGEALLAEFDALSEAQSGAGAVSAG